MRAFVVTLALCLLIPAVSAEAQPAPPDTLDRVVPLRGIEVSTARAGDRAPVAVSRVSRAELQRRNTGQDTPMLLAGLPGVYAYSDAGNGIGYSYLSIRGFPQRRISVLVNGVPLNDPESHEVYWIDHPDLAASASEIQVQRGVGPALYGAAALGGAVSVETSPFTALPRFAATVSAGSYSTRRLMFEGNSGALANGWDLYGRYSRVETDGYRDQSDSRLWAYTFAARHTTATQSFRVNFYGGPEETHLAYLGVPRTTLAGGRTGDADRDRRFNPITFSGERDHFFEPHYELIHAWAPNASVAFTQTFFWFDGRGYYDEQRTGRSLADYRLTPWATLDTTRFAREYYALNDSGYFVRDGQGRATVERFDLVRRREVTNRHYGWVPRVALTHARGTLTVGGELRLHDGRHVGSLLSAVGAGSDFAPAASYYDYHPRTLSAGLFVREEFNATSTLRVTGDLAWRHQGYAMRDDRFDGIAFDQSYDFALPRLGVSWTPTPAWNAFASYAYASREPAFRDLYDAEGVGSVPLYRRVDVAAGVYEDPLIRPEHVHHLEMGGQWTSERANVTANVFRMDFRDELVYAGQFNTDLGYSILGNAARSLHQGVELSARVTPQLGALASEWSANATLLDQHFVKFREQYGPTPADEVSYDGKALGFFPASMANLSARLLWKGHEIGATAQYIGRIYVDNTETTANSIEPRTVLDLVAGGTHRVGGANVGLTLRLNNALDKRYETSGYLDYDAVGDLVPHLVPAAGRNGSVQVTVVF